MRALVTGAAGFAGSHLCRHLLDSGDDVIALVHPEEDDRATQPFAGRIHLVFGDVTHSGTMRDVLGSIRPDVVFHLAGLAFVPDGENTPARVMDVNLGGTINVAEALARRSPQTRLILAGSGEVYGSVEPGDTPPDESGPVAPPTLYAHSKWFAERTLLHYRRRSGLDAVALRLFNHVGPGQNPRFSIASFVQQIREIQQKKRDPILRVGNLEARRDFTDVRDIARAYRAVAALPQPPEVVNVCSGVDRSIREVLDRLIALSGEKVDILLDSERLRPSDAPRICGSPALIRRLTGWTATIPLDQTLTDWLES